MIHWHHDQGLPIRRVKFDPIVWAFMQSTVQFCFSSSFTPFNRMSSFHFMPEIYSRFSKCTCKMMSPPRFSICSLNPGSWNIYVLWLTPWTFRSLNMPFIQMNVPIHAGPVAYTRLPVNIMRSRQRGMSKELVSSHLFTLRLSISCGVTDLA